MLENEGVMNIEHGVKIYRVCDEILHPRWNRQVKSLKVKWVHSVTYFEFLGRNRYIRTH